MLKKSACFVLGSSKSSTYPRGYASGFDSTAALLVELFEHPADYSDTTALHTIHSSVSKNRVSPQAAKNLRDIAIPLPHRFSKGSSDR
jgi:hypothetical protein